jgi:hypothetical protein
VRRTALALAVLLATTISSQDGRLRLDAAHAQQSIRPKTVVDPEEGLPLYKRKHFPPDGWMSPDDRRILAISMTMAAAAAAAAKTALPPPPPLTPARAEPFETATYPTHLFYPSPDALPLYLQAMPPSEYRPPSQQAALSPPPPLAPVVMAGGQGDHRVRSQRTVMLRARRVSGVSCRPHRRSRSATVAGGHLADVCQLPARD